MFTPLRAVAAVVAVTVVLVLAERAVEDRAPAPRDEPVTATNVDTYPTRRATLPPGIRVIEEPKGFVATRDVLPACSRTAPGLRDTGSVGRGRERRRERALATLELSSRPTVGWRHAGTIGVDGGTAAFSSAEGAAARGRLLAKDDKRWLEQGDRYAVSLEAHDGHVTLEDIDDDTNLMQFSTGLGDGGYAIYAGLDAEQRPTRLVVDCGLLHLDWPR